MFRSWRKILHSCVMKVRTISEWLLRGDIIVMGWKLKSFHKRTSRYRLPVKTLLGCSLPRLPVNSTLRTFLLLQNLVLAWVKKG